MCERADLLNILRKSQSFIRDDGEGTKYLSFALLYLDTELALPRVREELGDKATVTAAHLRKAADDLWNIGALLDRIEWFREFALEDDAFANYKWREYVSIDIEHMHLEIRSLFDYAAKALKSALDSKNLPDSFARLLEKPEKYSSILPGPFQDMIKSAEWLLEVRKIRNNLVHHGAHGLVLGDPADGTLFQVYTNRHTRLLSRFMERADPAYVEFDLYAAGLVSRLLVFLDRLGTEIADSLELGLREGGRLFFSGLERLNAGIRRLEDRLRSEEEERN